MIEYCLTPASSISAIFMTRTSSTIYKHYMYIEMREELDYPDDDFWLLLERMEIWRRWKISPRWLLHALLFFQNLQMRSLTHGAWHSSITLPTMVDGQAFHIIIWQPQDGVSSMINDITVTLTLISRSKKLFFYTLDVV